MNARYAPLISAVLFTSFVSGQITVDNTQTASWLVQNVLTGPGVSISNVTFNGLPGGSVYDQCASFDGTAANVGAPLGSTGITNGLFLASGGVTTAIGPNNSGGNTVPISGVSYEDADLDQIAAPNISHDAAVLEFDFIPTGDSLKFHFVFGSEEYLEFVGSSFIDEFGFFLSGPGISGPYSGNAANIALVPGTALPISIDNINSTVNPAYYVTNGDGFTAPWNTDPTAVQFDGMTVVLEANALVQCGQTYHIKLAVSDVADGVLDSGVFLEAGSFTSTGQVIPHLSAGVNVNDSTMYEGCGVIPFTFHRLGDSTLTDTIHIAIGGTATPGVDYFPAFPNDLIYYPGDTDITIFLTIPLDPDPIETITIAITQNVQCSGMQITNNYTFYIDTPPPLVVVSNDLNSLCGQQHVLAPQVTGGTGNYTYLWSTGDTTSVITVSPGVTTTYYFTVRDTCSVVPVSDSITVTLPVYAPLQITVSNDTLVPCLGNAGIGVTQVTGGNGTYTYAWTLNAVSVGNTANINVPAQNPEVYYVVNVGEGCGTSISDSVLVGTQPLPQIQFDVNSITVICPGDTVTLHATNVTGGNGVYTYVWTHSGAVLSTADTLQVGVPFDAGYTITIADQCGYSTDTTVNTLLPHNAPFHLDLTPDTVICLADTVPLWAQVSGGSGYYTIDWPGENWSDPILPVSPPSNQTWTVNIHDRCGAEISGQVTVGVEAPVAKIVATNQGLDDWYFEAATLPTFCRNYRWDLGDSTFARHQFVSHSYLDLEEHWVHLRIVTFTGCIAEDSMLVRPPGEIYFPNAFTPDGDGVNDTFGPVGKYIDDFHWTIFDRWGEVVFDSNDFGKQWDGQVNGSGAAMTDVYVYKYKATGHLFPTVENYGHVTLLRGSNTK